MTANRSTAANWHYLLHFPLTLMVMAVACRWRRPNLFPVLRNSLIGSTAIVFLSLSRSMGWPASGKHVGECRIDTIVSESLGTKFVQPERVGQKPGHHEVDEAVNGLPYISKNVGPVARQYAQIGSLDQ